MHLQAEDWSVAEGLQVRHWVGRGPEHVRQEKWQEVEIGMQSLGSVGLGWEPYGQTHLPELRVREGSHDRQPLGEMSEQVLHEAWQG